ncbi:beta-sandwich domain-containing protein [Bdellovibrio sp. 22V]|uniref:beta-sandwich domain-containing protein n=1 Tax=Bdellovibrio TaxID=958 RepID=UPI002542FF1B|nr:beta-sandwich domain-containing protein [Bdellovibrio sp. 22V]WII73203.1 beta-sandwich domain-containing protein [Bdellovibrio sp. 22V]
MKLPILSSILVAATLFQTPVFAQVRPDPRPGDRRVNPRDDHGREICNPYRNECREGREGRRGRDDRDGRHGGYRPRPNPHYPPYTPPPRHNPEPRPYPDYPRHNYGEASVQFYGVTRQSGGEWLRVGFSYPSYIDYVRVELYRAALQIHEAYAITESGRRVYLNGLSYSGTFYAGRSISSEYIRAGERIVAVDIRAESMGANADVSVTVTSNDGAPSIYPVHY